MAIARIYKQPARAYLFDKPIQAIQDALGSLTWLNHIFGRSERLVQMQNGRRVFTPNVYLGKNEYIPLLPDNTKLGNYCFFILDEPQVVGVSMGIQNRLHAPFSLVVWVYMRKVETNDARNTEYVKETLLKTVRSAFHRHGSVELSKVYQRAENVFEGYSLDEVDNQYLMQPFAGFRITGELFVDEECESV